MVGMPSFFCPAPKGSRCGRLICRCPATSHPAEQRIQINLPAIADDLLEIESQCFENALRHRPDLLPHIVLAIDRMLNVIHRLRAGGGNEVAYQSTRRPQ